MDRLQELVRLHRMGTGAREVARLLRMGPNTERDYREALEVAGLLDGSVDDLPELEVLKDAVQQHLAKEPPAQMTSSIAEWEPRIVELAEQGLTAKPIYDRLRLEEPEFGTPVGAALVDPPAASAVAEAEAEARSLANLTRRRIRLGYLEYWNPPFLARAMRALRELDPPIVLEARNLYSAEVLAGLRDRSLEIGFVHLPVDDDRLTVRPLLEGRWSLVMPRAHPLAHRPALTVPDLTGEPLVIFDRTVNPPLHAWLLGRFAEAKLTPRIVYATTQPQIGVDLVREGVGSFLVASYVLRTLPRGLVIRPFSDLPPMRIGAAWRGDHRTPALTALLAALPKFPEVQPGSPQRP